MAQLRYVREVRTPDRLLRSRPHLEHETSDLTTFTRVRMPQATWLAIQSVNKPNVANIITRDAHGSLLNEPCLVAQDGVPHPLTWTSVAQYLPRTLSSAACTLVPGVALVNPIWQASNRVMDAPMT